MFIYYLLYACAKYENYFRFNGMDIQDASQVMAQNYNRLREILKECRQKELSDEEMNTIFGTEVEKLYHAVQRKEFVCKVSKVAYLGDLKLLARFWGNYYVEIDFHDVLQRPEVQKNHPEYENLRNLDVFSCVLPDEYHVFFGKHPKRYDVSSDFIWHYGKEIKQQIDEDDYQWIKGF